MELDLSPRRVDLLGEGFDIAVRMGALPDDALLAARRLTVFTNGLYASPTTWPSGASPTYPQDLLQHDTLRLPGRASGYHRARSLGAGAGRASLGRLTAQPRDGQSA